MTAPHEAGSGAALHRGGLWIPGDLLPTEFGTFQRGPLWVEWLAPTTVTRRYPLVLIHGGGGQGTDWLVTPDGRPGWAPALAEAGFAVYVVDRPGHGRSPHHPAVMGEPGGQGPVEMTVGVFAHPDAAAAHTQWPWGRAPGSPELDQLAASYGFLLADLAEAQELDARRITELLDLIGPAVLVTHSAGAPAGWLAADRRPGTVRGVVAVEPMGPPFVDVPGLGTLSAGLTSIPLGSDLPFTGLPVVVVTGSASPFAGAAGAVVAFLATAGATAEHLPLENRGIVGNGHGLIFEANSDETVRPVIDWIAERD